MSFDRLPDELVVRVFRCLLDEKENYARLRRTCRRFCFIINHKLLTLADRDLFPRLYPHWCCRICDAIWRAANLDLVQCKHLFIREAPRNCCLDSIKHLKHKLKQITELTLAEYLSGSGWLNVFLDTLTSVSRVSILDFYDPRYGPMPRRPEPLPAARRLASLSLNLSWRSNLEPSLLNVPARHLSINCLRGNRRGHSWLRNYLERHGSFVETVACKICCCYSHNKICLRSILERFDFDVTLVDGDKTQPILPILDGHRCHKLAWCMLATKRDGRAQGDACKATEVTHRRHTQAEHGGQSPFDKLPDELVVRIVRCLLDGPNCRHLKQLRATCKRFCSLINHKLLPIDEPQLPTVGRNVWGICVICYDLWRLTKFKHVKCRHFVMEIPIKKCCLETVEWRAANLETIVELTLHRASCFVTACLSAADLNTVLGSLSSVGRLNIDEEAMLTTKDRLVWKNRGRIMCGGRQVRVSFVKKIALRRRLLEHPMA
jgi:hypothetical protein